MARSSTLDRSGGGNRALNFFSAARKGVQSDSGLSGLFLVVLIYRFLAFLYAALVGSWRVVGVDGEDIMIMFGRHIAIVIAFKFLL